MTGRENGQRQQGSRTSMHEATADDQHADRPHPRELAAIRAAVADLLSALPQRPQRLRVSIADVTIDLDWRTLPGPAVPQPAPVVPTPAAVGDGTSGTSTPVTPSVTDPPAPGPDQQPHYVCAPTVGTFYHAPQPGAPSFVETGTAVTAGQQVGIVEAMKLMLPVVSDRAGTVAEILVADGTSVEYGERLIALGPANDEQPQAE